MNATTIRKIHASARRGARFLDRYVPGWERRVEMTKLKMEQGFRKPDGCGCILTQTHGDYGLGRNVLGLTADACAELGFLTPDECDYHDTPAWRELDEAWKNEIRKRRGTA